MEHPQIPEKCQVLVVGGGPGGSYAAAALAREGLDVVVLEADKFPRYHIGESMLASIRHLLRFIDLDEKFNSHGFTKKVGAAFKLNGQKREGYTDFIAAGGPENYAWNVVRSEADDLMFRHAGSCGAKIFDTVKINTFEFSDPSVSAPIPSNARPVAATWQSKSGATGTIKFEYLVDASGRIGLMSNKYLKNRIYNKGLRNVASWGYWKNTGRYGVGTPRENSPFFEALKDESGWAWLIPLHNGTTSVGIVMNQEIQTKKKQSQNPPLSTVEFYHDQLKLAPQLLGLLAEGELLPAKDSEPVIKGASDYSYSATSYAGPGYRIVGDAGAFIDPYFSSGVHLALTGGLSAASTICASVRGDCSEEDAAQWHTDRVSISYTRFLMVVLSAYKQIRAQEQPVLADFNEDNFDRAFSFFRPIIQGAADVDMGARQHLTQTELEKTLEFCAHAFEPTQPEERDAVLARLQESQQAKEKEAAEQAVKTAEAKAVKAAVPQFDANLSEEEKKVLNQINARKMMHTEDTISVGSFQTDVINGRLPRLERGNLTLIAAAA